MSDTMNHEEAMKAQTTERYLLGDLPENERDAFEEHYFECAICADDLRSGSAFVDAVRATAPRKNPFLERQQARRRRKYFVPLAAAASLIVGVLTMQLGFVAPLQTQLADARRPATPAVHMLSETRGEGSVVLDANRLQEFLVRIEPDDEAAEYRWSILDSQNHERMSQAVKAEDVKD